MPLKFLQHENSNSDISEGVFERQVNIVILGRVEKTVFLKNEFTKRGYTVALLSGGEPPSYAANLIVNATHCVVACGISGAFSQEEILLALMKAKDEKPSVLVTDIDEGSANRVADHIETVIRNRLC